MIKSIENINFKYDGNVEIDEKIKEESKKYWEELKEKSNVLHEGNILIVTDLEEQNHAINIKLKSAKFSYLMYCKTNTNDDIRCMFAGAYIKCDEEIMLVLNKYYDEKEYELVNLVGGLSDKKDIINNEYSSINCLKREFEEELGFKLDSNFKVTPKYIKMPSDKENPFRYAIGIIYEITTNLSKEQIKEIFLNNKHDNEITDLIFFNKNNFNKINSYEHKKAYIPELFEKVFK